MDELTNQKMMNGDYFATLAAPIADYSWEVTAALAGTLEVTNPVPANFRQPVIIVGFYAEVISTTEDDLVEPAVKDIAVEMNSNGDTYYTDQMNGAQSNMTPGAQFVQLGSLLVPARYTMIELLENAPDIKYRFKWKHWLPAFAASAWYENAHISLTMFCKFPRKGERNAALQRP